MIASLTDVLLPASAGGYAVGAFNVYNLEGVRAVTLAAEREKSPVILQVLPGAAAYGGEGLMAMVRAAATAASVPVAFHFDHSTDLAELETAMSLGVSSVMADGSALEFADNVAFVRRAVDLARPLGIGVEAELGRLTGAEDLLMLAATEGQLTDPDEAAQFAGDTGVDALAVCIGNVHGPCDPQPDLDFDRLGAIAGRVDTPLVVHGSSGLSDETVRRLISAGVCKLNVNSDIRLVHMATLQDVLASGTPMELLPTMRATTEAMERVVVGKLRLFGSAGQVR